jgi:vacuolar-type H+-ATPase subunit F/Vma7
MKKLLAMGTPEFVRLLQLGGASARLVEPENLPAALEAELANPDNGVILLDPALAAAVPANLSGARKSGEGVQLLISGQQSASFLRNRIRQVVGADLLASEKEFEKSD